MQSIYTQVSRKIGKSIGASLHKEGRWEVEPKLVKRSDGRMWEPSNVISCSISRTIRDLTSDRKLLYSSPTREEWSGSRQVDPNPEGFLSEEVEADGVEVRQEEGEDEGAKG